MKLCKAEHRDKDVIEDLLKKGDIFSVFSDEDIKKFYLLMHGDKKIGCAGLFIEDNVGILRSVAISDECRNKGLGEYFSKELVKIGQHVQLDDLYLATWEAFHFWIKQGFDVVKYLDCPLYVQAYVDGLKPPIEKKMFIMKKAL